MKPIELLLRLAKIREDQAMANARRATGQVNQAQGFQKQVLDYAKDYENQIMEGAKTGTTWHLFRMLMPFGRSYCLVQLKLPIKSRVYP